MFLYLLCFVRDLVVALTFKLYFDESAAVANSEDDSEEAKCTTSQLIPNSYEVSSLLVFYMVGYVDSDLLAPHRSCYSILQNKRFQL